DVPRFARQAGVLLGDRRVAQVLVQVGVDDGGAVDGDDHLAAVGADGQVVPLPGGLAGAARRRHDVINRAGVLVGGKLGVLGVGVVEDLNLHADAADVALLRGADVDAAVAAGLQAVLQAQFEVGVLALGAEPAAAALAQAHHQAVLDHPV